MTKTKSLITSIVILTVVGVLVDVVLFNDSFGYKILVKWFIIASVIAFAQQAYKDYTKGK